MKLLSFNCRGLASPSKHLALQPLLEIAQPDVFLLQETLRGKEVIVRLLEKTQKGWSFFGSNATGRSGGLAMGWNPKKKNLVNS
jgi:exonuclease III